MNKLLWMLIIFLMSAYVLYEATTQQEAISLETQIERHHRMMANDSEFFNPWQYRVFSSYMLEGLLQFYRRAFPGKPEIGAYLLLRFVQNLLIFYLSLVYYRALGIRNPFLIVAGMVVLCYCMSNSFFQSDLSFNTYFDIAFYLLAGYLILTKRPTWIIPLTLIAAFNRETSGFIPLMVLTPLSWKGIRSIPKDRLVICGVSLLGFACVFVLLRWYFGYRPSHGIHNMTSPLQYLSYNLTFLRLYPLLLGTLSVIPIVIAWNVNKLPAELRTWFWLIVPFWFALHLMYSNAMETRLFLVPQALIFIPAMLILTEQWYKDYLPARKELMT